MAATLKAYTSATTAISGEGHGAEALEDGPYSVLNRRTCHEVISIPTFHVHTHVAFSRKGHELGLHWHASEPHPIGMVGDEVQLETTGRG